MRIGRSTHCFSGQHIGFSPIINFTFGVAELVVVTFLLILVRFRKSSSYRGITSVLPIYHYVMFYALAMGIVVGVDGIMGVSPRTIIAYFLKWVLLRSCTEGLSIFLMHNGIGYRALLHATLGGIAWGSISGVIPLVCYYATNDMQAFYIAKLAFLAILIIFYVIAWISPKRWIHKRPALIRFALFNMCIVILLTLENVMILNKYNSDACGVELILEICDFLQPLVILIALRQDSKFWQGLYSAPDSNLNEPLLGVWELGRDTISMVADTITRLERRVVPIIPYARLKVDTAKYFSGGNARVYRGQFQNNQVAIKFLFSIELTPDKVVNFCDEATMLNSLQHPNIVKCFGVAVMPPALCLVTEFCEYGSLYDFLHSIDSLRVEITNQSSTSKPKRSRLSSAESSNLVDGDTEEITTVMSPIITKERKRLATVPASAPTKETTQDDENEQLLGEHRATEDGEINLSESAPDAATALAEAVMKQSRAQQANSGSQTFTATTLEKLGYSVNIRDSSEDPRNKALKQSGSFKPLQSAAVMMRSQEMGFGLGPKIQEDSTRLSSSLFTSIHSNISSRNSLGNSLPLGLRLLMAQDAASGVAFIHSNGLMHCDIKSLNFLVGRDLKVKLADLGEARMYDPVNGVDIQTIPRNINWSSPEVLRGEKHIDQKADVWSLAFVITEIFTGIVPFDTSECRNMTLENFKAEIERGLRPQVPRGIYEMYPELEAMLAKAWAFEAKDRIHAINIVDLLKTLTLQE